MTKVVLMLAFTIGLLLMLGLDGINAQTVQYGIVNSTKSTFTNVKQPTKTYGSFSYVQITNFVTNNTRYGYYEFDISPITANSANCISDVVLYLNDLVDNQFNTAENEYKDVQGYAFIFNYLNGNMWSASTLTWNTQSSLVPYASETLTFENSNLPSYYDPIYDKENNGTGAGSAIDYYRIVSLNMTNVESAISTYNSKVQKDSFF